MMWADSLKFMRQYVINYFDNKKFKALNSNIALPPLYMMFESFNINYRRYYEGGLETAQWISYTISPFVFRQEVNILDWGCGPARITRHLKHIYGVQANIFGTDYNPCTIQWCSEHIRDVRFAINGTNPPLSYPDQMFNIIIGISIFTHLSEANHYFWINELSRVMRPGGIAFITTHGDIFRSILTPAERKQYDNNTPVIRGKVTEGHRVFTAFQPQTWMRDAFSTFFTVLVHHKGNKVSWGIEQDYWILKKS